MTLRPVLSAEEIQTRLPKLAQEIREQWGQEEVTVLVLLNGALWFGADLLRYLPLSYTLKTLKVSSYGAGRESSGLLSFCTPLESFAGERVLILDDVLDSGHTFAILKEKLLEKGALEVKTCVAVFKENAQNTSVRADFVGFCLGNEFLVGYGMDDNQKYRNLPYIAVLEEEV